MFDLVKMRELGGASVLSPSEIREIIAAMPAACDEIERQAATLARIKDYGIDTRNYGDGDAAELWNRVDDYRENPDAELSKEDVREVVEWWAELHTESCNLDATTCEQSDEIKRLRGIVERLSVTADGESYQRADERTFFAVWRGGEADSPWRVSTAHVPRDPDEMSLDFEWERKRWIVDDAEDECEIMGVYSTREAAEAAKARQKAKKGSA